MRMLVTGGAGFIGSNLTDVLVAAGHEVAVADNLSRGSRGQVNAAAAWHEVDVTTAAFRDVLLGFRPEIVFHHAAQIDVRRSIAEPLFDTQSNVVGTVNVLQACVDAGVRRVVFASSGGTVYGDTDVVPTPEGHPLRPASVYGAAKVCGEIYGDVFGGLYGLEFVSLRYGNVYGPRQDPHGEAGVIAIFIKRLLSGEPAVINGDGSIIRDYVHVDDVVAANLAAAETRALGSYNVATGRGVSVTEIFTRVAAAVGSGLQAQHGPAKPGEQRLSVLDIGKAAEKLDWAPQVRLEDGMRRTVEWFRGNPVCR